MGETKFKTMFEHLNGKEIISQIVPDSDGVSLVYNVTDNEFYLSRGENSNTTILLDITQFVFERLKSSKTKIPCNGCGYYKPLKFKFCPMCGNSDVKFISKISEILFEEGLSVFSSKK